MDYYFQEASQFNCTSADYLNLTSESTLAEKIQFKNFRSNHSLTQTFGGDRFTAILWHKKPYGRRLMFERLWVRIPAPIGNGYFSH